MITLKFDQIGYSKRPFSNFLKYEEKTDIDTFSIDNTIVLKKEMTIKNTSTSGELWDALQSEYDNGESGSASWWVYGTVYFNLSSMTSGQENTVPFEFFR